MRRKKGKREKKLWDEQTGKEFSARPARDRSAYFSLQSKRAGKGPPIVKKKGEEKGGEKRESRRPTNAEKELAEKGLALSSISAMEARRHLPHP